MSNESKRYAAAMQRGDTEACMDIEGTHGVYGCPPEIVSMVLAGVDAAAERDALRTQLEAIRAAGGEEVEVVAITEDWPNDSVPFAAVLNDAGYELPTGAKLMTLAQHQRIVGAMAVELEDIRAKWQPMGALMKDNSDQRARIEQLESELAAIRAAGGEQVDTGYKPDARIMQTLAGLAARKPLMELDALLEGRDRVSARQVSFMLSEVGSALTDYAFTLRQDFDALHAQHQRIVAAMAAELEQVREERDAIAGRLASTVHYIRRIDRRNDHPGRFDAEMNLLIREAIRQAEPVPPLAGKVSVPRELLAKLVEEGRIGEVADDEWSLLNALLATPSMEVKS